MISFNSSGTTRVVNVIFLLMLLHSCTSIPTIIRVNENSVEVNDVIYHPYSHSWEEDKLIGLLWDGKPKGFRRNGWGKYSRTYFDSRDRGSIDLASPKRRSKDLGLRRARTDPRWIIESITLNFDNIESYRQRSMFFILGEQIMTVEDLERVLGDSLDSRIENYAPHGSIEIRTWAMNNDSRVQCYIKDGEIVLISSIYSPLKH